jgi:hypothetical protein
MEVQILSTALFNLNPVFMDFKRWFCVNLHVCLKAKIIWIDDNFFLSFLLL